MVTQLYVIPLTYAENTRQPKPLKNTIDKIAHERIQHADSKARTTLER